MNEFGNGSRTKPRVWKELPADINPRKINFYGHFKRGIIMSARKRAGFLTNKTVLQTPSWLLKALHEVKE